MKYLYFAISPVLAAVLLIGCKNSKTEQPVIIEAGDISEVSSPVTIDGETRMLIQYFKDNGDYVNSREFPSLIKASLVKEALDQNQKILVIDLRPARKYSEGHILKSVNKRIEDLPEYFEAGIKPFEYEKIVMVCDDGQISSYTASLLRLNGYGNVFAMRWGMSAWNRSIAESVWLSGLSGEYESRIEKKTNERPAAKNMPLLNTGLSTGEEISVSRFNKLFSEGSGNIEITADEVFSNPQRFYIINYERKDKYDDAHIPGAVRYKPNATLGFTDEMASIPADKTAVVYCGTGHNSGFAVAYLRLMGYDARTLKFGNNSFMVEWMQKDQANLSWLPFSESDINNFPLTVK
jgi:rhodanese-related sulfurtransferase